MEVRDYSIFWNGRRHPPVVSNLDGVKARIRRWVDWVNTRRAEAA